MTSLDLFPETDPRTEEPPEWGTGKMKPAKPNPDLWTPKPPTWHYSGDPLHQDYTLTQIKLSNVRLNDQLLPRPQDTEIGNIMIGHPFPAEHPYTSHTSQFAVFPKFDSSEDPKRGVDARRMPKNAEMPSNPYDITVVQKSKGFGYRHEVQALPPESMKRPLVWHEGDSFDQVVKTSSSLHKPYYPIPPKTYVSNLEQRDDWKVIKGNMRVAPPTANAMRNVERDQWQTTYDLNHTGLGPTNEMKLDNYDDKQTQLNRFGVEDDSLYPSSVPTYDPPRGFEGRLSRNVTAKPAPQTDKYPDPPRDPNYKRRATLHEVEEDRLWNGREYVSLPDTTPPGNKHHGQQWTNFRDTFNPEAGVATLRTAQITGAGVEPVPFEAAGAPPLDNSEHPLAEMRRQQHDNVQQIEAQNRWKVLEAQGPGHNLTARTAKMDIASVKTQPNVFYDHQGKYERERAGLYKTSYDPYRLQESMNRTDSSGTSGPSLMDYSDCHKDALNLPRDINQEMAEIIAKNRTLGNPGSVPQLHPQPSQYEAFEPYETTRRKQKADIQPQVETSDTRTQEAGITLTDSTYGESYGTQKFLQENSLPRISRNEPLVLMSHENQDLRGPRGVATPRTPKSVQFNSDITVATGAGAEPLRLSSAPITNPKQISPLTARPDSSPSLGNPTHDATSGLFPQVTTREVGGTSNFLQLPVPLHKTRLSQLLGGANQFSSSAANVSGAGVRHSWAGESAYKAQFPGAGAGSSYLGPGSGYLDMNHKADPWMSWNPGSGTPRPQSRLLSIQDSFTKSDARKRFHNRFPETNPDLRENMRFGKKHTFDGLNAQVLRGTPIVA